MKLGIKGKILTMFISIMLVFGVISFVVIANVTDKVTKVIADQRIDSVSKMGLELLQSVCSGEWEIRDGKLYKGITLMEGNYVLIDKIRELTGARITIFRNDTRVATNVIKEDGKRAINTKISQEIADKVLKQGVNFSGETDVVGTKCEVKYIPIKDKQGKVIGIWFVGIEKSLLDSDFNAFKLDFNIVLFIILIIGIIGILIFTKKITNNINSLLVVMKKASDGILNERVNVFSSDEIGEIAKSLNTTLDGISAMILSAQEIATETGSSAKEITQSAKEVCKVSTQISLAVYGFSKGAAEQATSTEKGNSKIIEVTEGIDKISCDMKDSENMAIVVNKTIDLGEKSVKLQEIKMNETINAAGNISEAISSLSEKSNEIGQILEVIKGISDQTNLLALNAAIEAARAGQQGRGFAVVAEEIRSLAEQSNVSVKKIGQIISEVQGAIDNSVLETDHAKTAINEQRKTLESTVRAFGDINSSVISITNNINNVAESTFKISKHAGVASDNMNNITSVAEKIAASSEELTVSAEQQNTIINAIVESCENLSKLTESLNERFKKFTV